MKVTSYLYFDGRCEEAIAFYQKALGAQVLMMMRFKDSPEPHPPGTVAPGNEGKIMHATIRIGESEVHASDGECSGRKKFDGFGLALNVDDAAAADKFFAALADGGTILMKLQKTFFAAAFGMVTDRFGVPWLIIA